MSESSLQMRQKCGASSQVAGTGLKGTHWTPKY